MAPDASTESTLKEVTISTDGAAVPNPGAGGYGVVLRFGKHCRELSGGFKLTTNNRMELMAVIMGMEALKERCKVTLYSDSQYIVESVNSGAVFRWRKNDWMLNPKKTKPVKNVHICVCLPRPHSDCFYLRLVASPSTPVNYFRAISWANMSGIGRLICLRFFPSRPLLVESYDMFRHPASICEE